MRKIVAALLLFLSALVHAAAPQPPTVAARAWILADLSSGQVLGSERAQERLEPASLTKIMTAYVVYQALRDKKLSLEQQVSVSEAARRAPGSRMFIDPRRPVTVDELIRGMVVQSANDASIALAELVAGSEEAFVQMMNQEAARLGMKNTKYGNATGLPHPQHYTTAEDLYIVTAALIRDFPQPYVRYYSQKEFRYNNISQPNRNRLLWLDPSIDGVKTGHTEAAGYCLVASSNRSGRRLVSVLLGATSESKRAQESQKLLNWGFQFFDSVRLYPKSEPVRALEVWKGETKTIRAGFERDIVLTVPKGEVEKLKAELVTHQPLVAPVEMGQRVGVLRVSYDGEPLAEYPLVALENAGEAGFFGRAWDTLRLWLK